MTFDTKAARALCEAATAGPWEQEGRFVFAEDEGVVAAGEGEPRADSNAAFIAGAKTMLPEACDEIERLRITLEANGPCLMALREAQAKNDQLEREAVDKARAWDAISEKNAEIERLRRRVAELEERLEYLDGIGLERGLKE